MSYDQSGYGAPTAPQRHGTQSSYEVSEQSSTFPQITHGDSPPTYDVAVGKQDGNEQYEQPMPSQELKIPVASSQKTDEKAPNTLQLYTEDEVAAVIKAINMGAEKDTEKEKTPSKRTNSVRLTEMPAPAGYIQPMKHYGVCGKLIEPALEENLDNSKTELTMEEIRAVTSSKTYTQTIENRIKYALSDESNPIIRALWLEYIKRNIWGNMHISIIK